MTLLETIRRARQTGRLDELADAIPYARFLGMTVSIAADDVITRLAYSDQLLGNAAIGALHGGPIGSLLESAGIFKLVWSGETEASPSISSKSTRVQSPPRFSRLLLRALSTRIRRIASAAAAKKCPLLFQCCTVSVSTRRR